MREVDLNIIKTSTFRLVKELGLDDNVEERILDGLEELVELVKSSKRGDPYSVRRKAEKVSFDLIRMLKSNFKRNRVFNLALKILDFAERVDALVGDDATDYEIQELFWFKNPEELYAKLNDSLRSQKEILLGDLYKKFRNTSFGDKMKTSAKRLNDCMSLVKGVKHLIDGFRERDFVDIDNINSLIKDIMLEYKSCLQEVFTDICQEILSFIPE